MAFVGLRGVQLLPAQGTPAPFSAPRQVALLVGLVLVAAAPVAMALICRDRAAVRIGIAALAAGSTAGVAGAIVFRADDLLPPLVFGLGVAAVLALPSHSWPATVAKLGAAAGCATASVVLSQAGWFDPLVLLVMPSVAAVDAWVDRGDGETQAEA